MCVCANKFSKGSAPSVTTSEQCFLMTSRTADAMSNEFKPSGGINGACVTIHAHNTCTHSIDEAGAKKEKQGQKKKGKGVGVVRTVTEQGAKHWGGVGMHNRSKFARCLLLTLSACLWCVHVRSPCFLKVPDTGTKVTEATKVTSIPLPDPWQDR